MDLIGHKAGFKGVDKERVRKTIEEASEGSKFFQNEKRKRAILDARLEKMLEKLERLKSNGIIDEDTVVKEVESKIVELENRRDLSRYILSVDMDAFFVSVELKYQPELRNKPVAVGGWHMISTSSYEARAYGVRAGMPGFIGKRLCPDLVFTHSHFDKYKEEAETVRSVLRKYDPNFTSYSLDEATLDITEYMERTELTPLEVGTELKEEIKDATGGLTASCGIASNKMLAKICSDINKPDGVFVLPNERDAILDFVSDLPCRAVPGIGKVTEKILKALQIEKCSDIYKKRVVIYHLLTPISISQLLRISLGIESFYASDGNEGSRKRSTRSIGAERTFQPTNDLDMMEEKLENMCATIFKRRGLKELDPRIITLKIKFDSFRVVNRSETYPQDRYMEENVVLSKVKSMLQNILKAKKHPRVRLLGVRLSRSFKSGQYKIDTHQPTIDKYLNTKLSEDERSDEKENEDDDILDSNEEFSLTQEEEEEVDRIASQSMTLDESNDYEGELNSESRYQCPVCGKLFEWICQLEMNLHVDECLKSKNKTETSILDGINARERSSNRIERIESTESHEKGRESGSKKRKHAEGSSRIKKYFKVIEGYKT